MRLGLDPAGFDWEVVTDSWTHQVHRLVHRETGAFITMNSKVNAIGSLVFTFTIGRARRYCWLLKMSASVILARFRQWLEAVKKKQAADLWAAAKEGRAWLVEARPPFGRTHLLQQTNAIE